MPPALLGLMTTVCVRPFDLYETEAVNPGTQRSPRTRHLRSDPIGLPRHRASSLASARDATPSATAWTGYRTGAGAGADEAFRQALRRLRIRHRARGSLSPPPRRSRWTRPGPRRAILQQTWRTERLHDDARRRPAAKPARRRRHGHQGERFDERMTPKDECS